MKSPRDVAFEIVRRLSAEGHVAYFAGGCVRDELLGLAPKDYDVATDATPKRVAELFPRTRAVGKAFGVVLVRESRVDTEVATFREDGVYTDGRRPDTVAFSDARADAQRRDFTINALFSDPLDGDRVIDYVGGVADLEARVVRAVGVPAERLREDHLRSLRAVRFAARLGFGVESATADAVRACAGQLAGVSRERVGDEMRKMMAHPTRAEAARLAQELGLDAPALGCSPLPGATLVRTAALPGDAGAMLGLAGWLLDRASAAGETPDEAWGRSSSARLQTALMLSNEESAELAQALTGYVALRGEWAGARMAQQKRWAASVWFAGALALVAASDDASAKAIQERVAELAETPSGLAPAPLVTGDTLIESGLQPGPMFGKWLASIYDEQLEGRVVDAAVAIERVHAWAARGVSGPADGE